MNQETVKTKKAVAVNPQASLPTITKEFTDGGWDTEVIDTKDILIPKLLLMHGQSVQVLEGKKNQGDLIRSTDLATLAKRDETLDVIIFEKWKTWRVMELVGKKYEWRREEPCTDESLAWDFKENGKEYRRDLTLNFYGVLAKEAGNDSVFPLKISFTRTSYKTGKIIADAYARALMEKQAPTRQVFSLGSKFINGDDNKYFVFTATPGEATTEAQKAGALKWRKVVMQAKQNNEIQDHEEEEVVSTGASTIDNSEF